MKEMILLILSLFTGTLAYLVPNFWMKPILRYLDIRHEVTADLVFYANVLHETIIGDELKKRAKERRVSNRKHASEFVACYYRLPFWYKWILRLRKESPLDASSALIGLSNSSNDTYAVHERRLRSALRVGDTP